jgi:SAM-dependent methyltransferase
MGDNWMNRPFEPAALDTEYFERPSPARMWNYLQGGDDHYPLDREAGDAMAASHPEIFDLAKQTRRFLIRAAEYLAQDFGVRQFLDIGCGLPSPHDLPDLHEVAQNRHSDARVVYVDNDKVVMAHAQGWSKAITHDGRCDYLEEDARNPEAILAGSAETLDFTQPVAVCLLGVLGHIPDYDEALSIVRQLMAAVPSGSFLIFADGFDEERLHEGVSNRNDTGIDPYTLRTIDQFNGYAEGLELLEPGVTSVSLWRPEPVAVGNIRPVMQYGGVARKS